MGFGHWNLRKLLKEMDTQPGLRATPEQVTSHTLLFVCLLGFLYLSPRDWTGQSIRNSGHNKKCNTPADLKPSIRNRQPKNCIPFYSEKQYSKGLFRISNWKGGKKFSLSLTHKIWELPVGQGFISGGNSRVLSSQEI